MLWIVRKTKRFSSSFVCKTWAQKASDICMLCTMYIHTYRHLMHAGLTVAQISHTHTFKNRKKEMKKKTIHLYTRNYQFVQPLLCFIHSISLQEIHTQSILYCESKISHLSLFHLKLSFFDSFVRFACLLAFAHSLLHNRVRINLRSQIRANWKKLVEWNKSKLH